MNLRICDEAGCHAEVGLTSPQLDLVPRQRPVGLLVLSLGLAIFGGQKDATFPFGFFRYPVFLDPKPFGTKQWKGHLRLGSLREDSHCALEPLPSEMEKSMIQNESEAVALPARLRFWKAFFLQEL